MAAFELKAGPLSLSWGGSAPAPAPPPPLPAPAQKGGGPVPEPFNRMLNTDALGERNVFTRPMAQSVWVMSGISIVAEPISAAPLKFSMTDGEGSESLYQNPALSAFWKTPVRGMSLADFMLANVGWNLLAGESFWILDDSWLLNTVTKSPLMLARPGAMTEIVNRETQQLVGWEWMYAPGQKQLLIPDQVVQIKNWNPYNMWRGLSKMEAAFIASEADYLQGRFAGNLARNNGDRGAIIGMKNGGMLNETQMRQVEMQLRMKREAALRGDMRPLFLAGDVSVEDPKIQTPDADFVAQRIENRHEIYNAFGVPMSMADIAASYSIGSASDLYRLVQFTCIPMATKFCGAIETVSKRYLRLDASKPLTAKFNFDQHPVMQQARAERLASADKLWSKGVPMKVCNDYLGLELPEFDGWDIGYLPFNVAPVQDASDPLDDPQFNENTPQNPPADQDDSIQQLKDAFARRAGSTGPTREANAAHARLWKKHMAQRLPAVRMYQAKLKSLLTGARSEVLAKLASHYQTVGKAVVTKAGAASNFMFNLHDFTADFRTAMDAAARSAYQDAGQQMFDELGQDDPWTSPPAKLKEFLTTRENKLKDVPQEIFDQVKNHLQEGIDQGESIKDLAQRVASTFDEINLGRARTIAMTEVGAGYGTARQDAMQAAGVEYKRWLTSGNANVRPAHAEAEGQVRQIDQPYDVDGEEIDFPGDPEGSPENVINCHCVSIAEEA